MSEVRLTECQQKAFDAMMRGENVFLSGDAGSGKTFVLSEFIKEKTKEKSRTLVCAPTGIAALQLEGTTIHRAFKLGIKAVYDFVGTSKGDLPFSPVVLEADTIIIDEISMCRADLFDYLTRIIERCTVKGRPKQLIVCGDFYQLPPIVSNRDIKALSSLYPMRKMDGYYPFEGVTWDSYNFTNCVLRTIVRQSDQEFVDALNQVRRNDTACLPYFNDRVRMNPPGDVIQLMSRNATVDHINKQKLDGIDEEEVTFYASSSGMVNPGDKPVPDEVALKVGARVMSVVNSREDHYRNGSMGIVKSINEEKGYVVVSFDNGNTVTVDKYRWEILKPTVVKEEGGSYIRNEVVGVYTQMPLRLAYAITIHKAQGQTYDACHVDTDVFMPGQLYVALSRCSTIEGLTLNLPLTPDVWCKDIVNEFYTGIYIKDAREG